MLTAVFRSRAGKADDGFLLAGGAVGFPAEEGEGPAADFAFGTVVFFDHLHEGCVFAA